MNNKIYFFYNQNNRSDILKYYNNLDIKIRKKIIAYILTLLEYQGKIGAPYTKHIKDKIWELRIDYNNKFHRIFYFMYLNQSIVLLHGYDKKTNKTPNKEIEKAINNYNNFIKDKIYEKTKTI